MVYSCRRVLARAASLWPKRSIGAMLEGDTCRARGRGLRSPDVSVQARWTTAAKLVVLVVLLAVWVLVPHPLEGPVLFTITATHGIHLGDLLGVAVAAVVGWRWLP